MFLSRFGPSNADYFPVLISSLRALFNLRYDAFARQNRLSQVVLLCSVAFAYEKKPEFPVNNYSAHRDFFFLPAKIVSLK